MVSVYGILGDNRPKIKSNIVENIGKAHHNHTILFAVDNFTDCEVEEHYINAFMTFEI